MFSGKLFRSRWAALLWSAGILWTAYDVASASPPAKTDAAHHSAVQNPGGSQDAAAVGITNQDMAVLHSYLGN
jgi:hypothetical protein